MGFSVGVNYWPRGSAAEMWRRFDDGAIADDLGRIAGLGLDAIRVLLPWDQLQPRADAVDPGMLDRLARVLALANDRGLRVLPALCGALGERSFVPAWARAARDLYRGPLLDAQVLIARTIAERFGGSPAIVAWDIGHAFSRVRAPRAGRVTSGEHASEPVAEREVAEWSRALAAALRAGPVPATAGAVDGDLMADTNVRFGSLCAPFAFASIQSSTLAIPVARNRLDPEAVPFVAMMTAAFSFKPVLVTAVGNPTCPPGKFSPYERFAAPGEPEPWTVSPEDPVFAPYPCLSEAENAAYATAGLERLHADGRLGAYWWCWCDGDDDAAPHERTYGIVRRDGSEKPVAAALAAFARQKRELVRPNDMPMISSTYYYRTLPVSTRTLYDAYLGSIEARR